MRLTTAEREKLLTQAIDYFHSQNGTVSVRKATAKFKAHHSTLSHRINGTHGTIASNGGLNRLIAVA
jgi:hypothetical protein